VRIRVRDASGCELYRPVQSKPFRSWREKNLEWRLNAFAGQDGIGIRALEPEVDPSKEILDTFNFVWTNRDMFVSGGVNWLLGDKLSLRILGGYENWVSETDGSFLERPGAYLSRFRYDSAGNLWGISCLANGTPVYRKDIFSTKAEDNDILVSFAYLVSLGTGIF